VNNEEDGISNEDAFHLMVRLRMSVHVCSPDTLEEGEEPFSEAILTSPQYVDITVPHGDDPAAATRRAIEQCAAAIGAQI
jgi:hypothetical protein